MKKLFSILLTLVLALTAMSFAAAEIDVIGNWYLTEAESEGIALDPTLLGIEMSMTLNADGSCTFDVLGDVANLTWTQSGNQINLAGGESPIVLTIEGETLFVDQEGVKLIFTREQSTAEVYTAASVRSDASADDFQGTWNATIVDIMGMQMGMETTGMGMTIVINGDKATMIETEGTEKTEYSGTVTFENGTATLNDGGEPVTLYMLEDGTMAIIEEEDGMTMSIYFSKAA